MSRKKDLLKELNVGRELEGTSSLDVDIKKIKSIVNNGISSAGSERKSCIMKSRKKICMVAIAATFVLGITAFAASRIVSIWYSGSSGIPEYTSLPTSEQCIKDIGYEPVLIDEFENGYAFKNGSVVKNRLADDTGSVIEKFNSVTFRYEKEGDGVNFSQEKFISEHDVGENVIAKIDEIDIYYTGYTNKFVPADYIMTDEDKKAEESGELVFSYGSSEVDIVRVQSIYWYRDGIRYSLMQMDGKLTQNDLMDMAREAIEK